MRRPREALARARAAAADTSTPEVLRPQGNGGPPATSAPRAESRKHPVSARRFVIPALLLLVLAAGLVLRLRHIGYGLPYVYNYDEETHFTSKAVAMLGGDLNPGYFQNPSGITYLIYLFLKLKYGILGGAFPLAHGSISKQFLFDPTPIFKSARELVAFVGMVGVLATYWVGRRLWSPLVGLVAAALLAFAFLPVTYSRIAVTDVGTFLPVAIAVYGTIRAYETDRLRYYLIAGLGIGLTIGFKYTAGLLLVPLFLVAGRRLWIDRKARRAAGPDARGEAEDAAAAAPAARPRYRRELGYVAAALGVMALAFVVTTPYFVIHLHTALFQLKQQAVAAGDTVKLGQEQQGGFYYYFNSLTWGFGWAALAFALFGAVMEFRRDRFRALLLVSFPIVLYLYMGTQTRYFGRWLLSMYPVLALLGGVGLVRLSELVTRRRALQYALLAIVCAAVLVQPLAADIRTSNVLGRTDTRSIARAALVRDYRPALRIVIEPAVPAYYYSARDQSPGQTQFVRALVKDIVAEANNTAPDLSVAYATTLSPQLIDTYRRAGYCLVMTLSVIRGRAENGKLPKALAYYKRLERESRRIFYASPYKPGRGPVPLNYDFSYDYYPTAYFRPGPEVSIYRLDNCTQGYGKPPTYPLGHSSLDKGIGSTFAGAG